MNRFYRLSLAVAIATSFALPEGRAQDDLHKGNWVAWRGPLQNGISLERFADYEFNEEPIWTDDIAGRGTPVVFDGRIYSWGYRGQGADLEEVVQARDEETGEVIWERATHDFLSDTIYDRYTIGALAVDTETGNIIVATTYGLVTCYTRDGDPVWEHSMIERFGRLTFPNGRAGAPVVDGDIVIVRGVTSYWGADGPARDRFFGFDKKTGDLLWSSSPGVGAPYLKDSSFSTPVVATRDGRRVFYVGTGCGNIACVNVNDGTPLWRYQTTVGGVNATPVVSGDVLYTIHGTENLDSTEMGRGLAIKLPEDFGNPGGEVEEGQGGAPKLTDSVELWRNGLEMFTSSPVLVEDRLYQLVATGRLHCVDKNSGEFIWDLKLANHQLHASPLYADGKLYVAMYPGEFYVIDISGDEPEILHEIKLEGNCIGSPSLCNGRVYVHTTQRLYAFEIKNSGISWDEMPAEEKIDAGEPTKLLTRPSDVLLEPGDKREISLVKADAKGNPVGPVDSAEWSNFIPPTARVQSTMDASFSGNTISVAPDGDLSAGAWKAEADGLSGILRGRVIGDLPLIEDFEEGYEIGEEGFAFPPLAWIGARLKWDVREVDGNKVLAKTLDRLLFQRSLSFIGHPDLSGYTMQADIMTDGNRRIKSVGGLIVHRYIVSLVGNSNVLEVSSNFDRVRESVPFPISANKWYTLKTRVDINEDGSGVVRAKAWARDEEEPDAWTIEVEHANAHKKGAPGIFGFAPQSQMSVYLDNISVTPGE